MGCCKCSRNEGGGNFQTSGLPFLFYNDNKKDERIRQLEEELEKEKNKNKNKNRDEGNDDERIRQLEEDLEKEKKKNNDLDESSEYESSSQSPADIKINIKYNNQNYKFMTKLKYDLNKVLYKFKKENKNIKPKGHFLIKNKKIDDLSKTCGELDIKYDDNIILE